MKLKIKTDSGEQELELRNPKGRHTKKAFKLLMAAKKDDGTEDLKGVEGYTDYLDEVAAECTGQTLEWLDDLDDDEKQKIVSFYHDKVMDKFDFLKSSLKLPNSVQKDTTI